MPISPNARRRPLPQAEPEPASGDQREERDRQSGNQTHRRRPGRDGFGDGDHAGDPPSHGLKREPLEAQRHQEEGEDGAGHDPQPGNRHGEQVGHHAERREPVEVIGGERSGGEAGDQGGQGNTERVQGEAPQEPGICAQPGKPFPNRLVDRDQGDHGRERHLEARAQQAFRGDRQHHRGGRRDEPHRDCRAVQQHRQQHRGKHEEGALGGDRGARDHQVDQGARERSRRRPFLDRVSQRDGRDGGETRAHAAEQEGRHQREVEPRDGEQVSQPRIAHRDQHPFRDGTAFAGGQGGRHRPFRAREGRRDAPGYMLAQPVDAHSPAGRVPRRNDRRPGDRKTDRAQALEEPRPSREIEPAGNQGGERRLENRAHRQVAAGFGHRTGGANADPNAARRRFASEAIDPGLDDRYTPSAALRPRDGFYRSADRDRADASFQYRRGDRERADLGKREPGGERDESDQGRAEGVAPERAGGSDQHRRDRDRPLRRFDRQREIDRDSEPEKDRQPEDPAAALAGEAARQKARVAKPAVHRVSADPRRRPVAAPREGRFAEEPP